MTLEEIKKEATKLCYETGLDESVAFMITHWPMNEFLMDLGILRVEEHDYYGVMEWIKGFR